MLYILALHLHSQTILLKEEFQYYLDHQQEFVEKHNGKVLVIKDSKLKGIFDNVSDAYADAAKKFELGTFLIQKCTPGDQEYTQTFHSRAIFA